VDDEGCIYVLDRYKDMYISGGENVYPAEIEQVIFQLEMVADVGVIGVADDRWGECGLAVVVLKPGVQADAPLILEHCRQNLAKFKVPKTVIFTEQLPRNAAGKVLKRELKDHFGKIGQQ
jgi:fatty-acyl-CoA synthase